MKKTVSIQLVLVMAAVFLTGCGLSKEITGNSIEVQKKGTIVENAVIQMDESYYDEDELEQFVEDEITTYNAKEEGTVKEEDFSVKDGTARLVLKYDSSGTYSSFNKRDFFSGTVVQALAEGYAFDREYFDVSGENAADGAEKEDTVSGDIQAAESTEADADGAGVNTGSLVSKSEIVSDPDNYVVILEENTTVQIKGKILYATSNVTLSGKDTAVVTGYGDDAADLGLTYIIYK